MSFTFPEFSQPTAIDAQRAWTAVFESYDQRNDDAYYIVTLHEAGRSVERFFVQVGLHWAGDDWTGPEFLDRLRDEIDRVARTGKSNTSYRGSMLGPRT
jgi:hypothetical protein